MYGKNYNSVQKELESRIEEVKSLLDFKFQEYPCYLSPTSFPRNKIYEDPDFYSLVEYRDTPNSNAEDFIGKQFGVLTVEKEIAPYRDSKGHKQRRFRCRCYCGKLKDTRISELKEGVIVSCGCLSARDLERLKVIILNQNNETMENKQ